MQPTSIQHSLSQAKADPSIAWARFSIPIAIVIPYLNSINCKIIAANIYKQGKLLNSLVLPQIEGF